MGVIAKRYEFFFNKVKECHNKASHMTFLVSQELWDFWGDENVPKLTLFMVEHICEHTKNQWILLWVDCMVCELHLNKAVLKKYPARKEMTYYN